MPFVSGRWLVVLFLALSAPACAPALSGFTPARVGPRGTVRGEMGFDASIATGGLSEVVDTAEEISKTAASGNVSDDDVRRLAEGAAALLLNPPLGFNTHIGLGYAIIDRLEISARYAGSALGLGGRYQVLEQDRHGVDLSVGLGVARYTQGFPVDSVLDVVTIDEFTRWQFDIPIVVGQQSTWYRWWGGPKLLFTSFDAGMQIELAADDVRVVSLDGDGLYLGGQAGFALGYEHIFVGLELTVVSVVAQADLVGIAPQLDGNYAADDLIIYPGLALLGSY